MSYKTVDQYVVHLETKNTTLQERISELTEQRDIAFKSADFNFEQYQDAGRLLHEECERVEMLSKQRNDLLNALEDSCKCIGFGGFSDEKLHEMADEGHMTVQSLLRFRALIAAIKEQS